MKKLLRRLLRTREDVSLQMHATDWFWKNVMRVNTGVPWPVHFTSRVTAWKKIKLGRGSCPGDMPGCYIQGLNGITVGEGCQFGPGVGLISANHDPQDLSRHVSARGIVIGDFCWLGMHAVVLPGVELGHRTIVGAGSVVTTSFPEGHCVIAGNPARLIKKLKPGG